MAQSLPSSTAPARQGGPGQPDGLQLVGRLSIGLVAVTYVLLVFGASVRVHGAGLACPDWPLCFGEVIPPIDFQVSLEFGHRVLAGLISLGFLGLVAGVLEHRETLGRGAVALSLLGVIVLALQIVLGGLTVLELLAEWTVTSHLLAGNTFCLLLLLVALRIRDARAPVARPPVHWSQRATATLLAVLVAGQLALGGLVSSSYAGLVCGTWPTCDGTSWFPTFSGLVGLQVTHRLMAYVLLAVAAAAVVVTRGRGRSGQAAITALAFVLLQAAIGVANVLLRLPVEITLAHTAGAAAVVLSTTWLNHEVWLAPLASGPARVASDEAPTLAQGDLA